MLKVLVTGGGGMLGQKLAKHLGERGLRGDRDLRVTLADIAFPEDGAPGTEVVADMSVPGTMAKLAAGCPDVIFHLASVVSGEAEEDYAKGWSTNMSPMWELLEALRERHDASGGEYVPRIVFTSSIAVFGGPFPARIDDQFLTAPQTSYGAQKAVCELMLGDASRKGWVDGISIRLPTICVRPGMPNRAASGFFSGIIREPLNGEEAVLPVEDTVRHWMSSPRSAVGFMVHAAGLDTALLEGRRSLNMPGVSCTVGEQIEALGRVAGTDRARLIRREPDPVIMNIVSMWPRDFEPARALALGFSAERDFDRMIRIYMEDELGIE
ncbi:MAG: SDR family oxidoreductase [Rhodobacter sp.]|nr:SDR family oxidoreductase [Rhodobacter sp.]